MSLAPFSLGSLNASSSPSHDDAPYLDSPTPAPRGFAPVSPLIIRGRRKTPLRRVLLKRFRGLSRGAIKPLVYPGVPQSVLRGLKREGAFYVDNSEKTPSHKEFNSPRHFPRVNNSLAVTMAAQGNSDEEPGAVAPISVQPAGDSEVQNNADASMVQTPLEGYLTYPEFLSACIKSPGSSTQERNSMDGVFVYSRNPQHIPAVIVRSPEVYGIVPDFGRWNIPLNEQPVDSSVVPGFQSRLFREIDLADDVFVPQFDPREDCNRHAHLLALVDSRTEDGGLTLREFRAFARNCWRCRRYAARFVTESHQCILPKSPLSAVHPNCDTVGEAGINVVVSNPGVLLSRFLTVRGSGISADDFQFLFLQCQTCDKIVTRQAACFHKHP